KVIVNNNNSYGQILWEQLVLGFPEYAVRHREPEADFGSWARGCGAHGEKVTQPGRLEDAIKEAFAQPGPAIVDVTVNPNEPPMPPKVEYRQAKALATAFLRGQPNKSPTVAAIARDKLQQLFS